MFEEPKYSRVKIEVLKAEKSTYWYADLVGKIIEVEKQVFDDGSIGYKSLDREAAYFFENDIEEINNDEPDQDPFIENYDKPI